LQGIFAKKIPLHVPLRGIREAEGKRGSAVKYYGGMRRRRIFMVCLHSLDQNLCLFDYLAEAPFRALGEFKKKEGETKERLRVIADQHGYPLLKEEVEHPNPAT